MPPIWEYAPGGYRPADALSGDMGLPDPATDQLGLPFVGFALFEPRPEKPKLLEE